MGTIMQTRGAEIHRDPAAAERFRLDGLTRRERSGLEEDLQLATEVQQSLLPGRDIACRGWRISNYYQPASPVGGDYCDVVDAGKAGVYFMLGDVCGKGVAAAMVTAHLHGIFRTLISMRPPVKLLLERVNSALCESSLPYATLVCGRASLDGTVEMCDAGHPLPLVVRDGSVMAIKESGLPAGMFADEEFPVSVLNLKEGQRLVLYSDGVSEARDISGLEYGAQRLREVIGERYALHPSGLVAACCAGLSESCRGAKLTDDISILALGRDICVQ
jgi:sigma-B regulation protein RsbU (phosphoserine phosphatase)